MKELNFKKLFIEGQRNLNLNREKRIEHIEDVYKNIIDCAKEGNWNLTLLVYEADDFIERISKLASETGELAGLSTAMGHISWTSWLAKGVLRYIFLQSNNQQVLKWRYLLGSSSRGKAFSSRASFQVATWEEVESIKERLGALGAKGEKSSRQQKTSKYLIVHVLDCKIYSEQSKTSPQYMLFSDILDKVLSQYGLNLVMKLTLSRRSQ